MGEISAGKNFPIQGFQYVFFRVCGSNTEVKFEIGLIVNKSRTVGTRTKGVIVTTSIMCVLR